MQNQDTNIALIQVQINSLERTKERLWIRAMYAFFYGIIMNVFFVILLVMGNPFFFVLFLFSLIGIGVYIYHYQRIKAINYDIWTLKNTIQSKDRFIKRKK